MRRPLGVEGVDVDPVHRWWWTDDPLLPADPRALITDPANEVLVSSVSAWEVSTKYNWGKLPQAGQIAADFASLVDEAQMTALPMSLKHALRAGALERHHRDPFDRMLIAQGQIEGIPIVTQDAAFVAYDIELLW